MMTRNLRDHARRDHVALEDLAIAAERRDAFLDAGAAGIEQADDRRAVLQRHVLDLVIFWAWVSESEPPNTVKSLANTKTVRPLTVPQPVTTPSPGILVFSMPKSSSGAARTCRTPRRSPVEQQFDALARGQLAALVLRVDALASPPPQVAFWRSTSSRGASAR
jgi:hypothetical protein